MSEIVEAVLNRVEGGRWPIGWALLSGPIETSDDMMSLFLEIVRASEASAVLFTHQAVSIVPVKPPHAVYTLPGHGVVPVLREVLLPSGLFRSYLIWMWDEVGPEDEAWGDPTSRTSYLSRQAREMGPEIAAAKATIFATTFSPRAGGRGFQADVQLRLDLLCNHRGTVLTVGGRRAVPANRPLLIRGK